MKVPWKPEGRLDGKYVLLSASIPSPERHRRFLKGPFSERAMLSLITERTSDAVTSLVSQTLQAGGRIVHGGHPRIFRPLADHAVHWTVSPDIKDLPIRIYQSEYYKTRPAPPGREELEESGVCQTIWVPTNPHQILAKFRMEQEWQWLSEFKPKQGPPNALPEELDALFALRLQMLLETKPVRAYCIGGMEGIQAEAELYLALARKQFIPGENRVIALRSSYGASAQFNVEGVVFGEDLVRAKTMLKSNSKEIPFESFTFNAQPREYLTAPSPDTVKEDMDVRVCYDDIMRLLVGL